MESLISSSSRIEVPFVSCFFGGMSFGVFDKQTRLAFMNEQQMFQSRIQYPNFIESCEIEKNANGSVNTYRLVLKYQIRPGDDPNLFEKIFSTAQTDRKIIFNYGDYTNPSFSFRQEEALITDVSDSTNFASASITYNVTAVSNSVLKITNRFNFNSYDGKPSDLIKNLIYDAQYGLLELFPGMMDKSLVNQRNLIASNDKSVHIEPKMGVDVLSYIKYVMSNMISTAVPGVAQGEQYFFCVYDDIQNEFGGQYFKISYGKMNDTNADYEINIGFPNPNVDVISFSKDTNQTFALLYNYNKEISKSNFEYRWNNDGEKVYLDAPDLRKPARTPYVSDKTWWTKMTEFPLQATLTMRGLLRNVILMEKIKINVTFYGREHYSSGYYSILGQSDSINTGGYRTTLKLLRVGTEQND